MGEVVGLGFIKFNKSSPINFGVGYFDDHAIFLKQTEIVEVMSELDGILAIGNLEFDGAVHIEQ